MDYSLAQKLKNAGFPQSNNIEDLTCECGITGCEIHNLPTVYIPTLSELLEECGDKLISLNRTINLYCWYCNEN